MRMQSKVVQVPNNPDYINDINELASYWGWSVRSVQITDHKTVREGDSVGWADDTLGVKYKQIITEHTNYATITYERDMDMPQYRELCRLETEYNRTGEKSYQTQEEDEKIIECDRMDRKGLMRSLISIPAFIVFAIIAVQERSGAVIYGGLLICGIYGITVKKTTNNKTQRVRDEIYRNNKSRMENERSRIIDAANAIMNH